MPLQIIIDQHYKGLNPILFGHQQCKARHRYGPAIRTHWLLHYIVSGYGEFTRDGQTYKLGPGQIFVIPPYVETVYEADAVKPWKYIWIGFTTEDVPEVFLDPVITCPNAGSIFNKMFSCYDYGNGSSAYLSSCLWELVSILLDRTDSDSTYIKKARHYINANYANGITIQEVADALGLHRGYFSAIFKKHMRLSPSEYLTNLRLNKAAELLTSFDVSVATAAASVGYNDIYHFSKAFKKYFGVSPREYCKNTANRQ